MRVYYSPISELMELQRRVGRVFDDARAQRGKVAERSRMAPAADLVMAEGEYVARFDLPGVEAGDVKISAEEGLLTVRGTKQAPEVDEGKYARRERAFGEFSRSLALPSDADTSQASANLEDGVLTVKIARRAPVKHIEVPVT